MGSLEEPSGKRGDLETIHSHCSQIPNGIHTSKREIHDKLTSYDDVSPNQVLNTSYPIAICGLAMRLPGGIHDARSFWDFIVNKKDARTRVPESRYNVDSFHSSAGKTKSVIPQHGYFLEDADLGCLDTSFFSMSKDELEKMDPQQRQFLEVTRECLENANETGWGGKRVGCYVGVFGEDWLDSYAKDTQVAGLHRIQGYGDWTIANRTSYEFDFKGPSMTIRTACSSALTGLHEACQALRTDECTSAIVGGTNLIVTPTMTIAMSEQGVLSPEGSCKTFDAKADGYARGEAITALYLKRLDHALCDGNPIRAVIRSTAVNCDGKTPGLSYPSSETHEALIRRAYRSANLDIDGTAFVECHGTGTAVGDPLETTGIGNVFHSKGVYIGSVKPNLGHSEGASGITSIIKMVLALEKRIIPPNIKFIEPNPKIPFHAAKLKVPTEAAPWPSDRKERVGVNSFGIGGSNAHVILDSAASFLPNVAGSATASESKAAQLLVFSANTAEALRRTVDNYHEYVAKCPDRIQDLSFTLSCQREHLTHRAFCVVNSNEKMIPSPIVKAKGAPRLVMVFTGQGAQWPQMGRDLILGNSTFRYAIRAMDHALSVLANPPSWTIEDELLKSKETSRLDDTEFAQPLCTAIQVALVDTLAKYGIRADAVVGHSSGEIAAAYAAGGLGASEAIVAAYQRGQIAKGTTNAGSMAAVGLGRDQIVDYLVGRNDVVIACENSPNSVTISGESEGLDVVLAAIKTKEPECFTRKLRVSVAYHSHLMKLVGNRYISLIEGRVTGQTPVIPFFSSVYGQQLNTKSPFGPQYWQANLESPVLFNWAVSAILENDTDQKLFLEVGPHPTLAGPLRQIFKAASSTFSSVATLQRNKQDVGCLLESLGHLYAHAVPVNFSALFAESKVEGLTDLPPYPWNHETTYWNESRLSRDWRFRKFPHHDILGSRVTESTDSNPSWRNNFLLKDVPWIRDHKIHDDIVFPFAAYVAMAGAAVRQLQSHNTAFTGFALRRMVVNTALVLQESQATEIVTSFVPRRLTDSLDSGWFNFTVSSYNGRTWVKHCVGQVRAGCTFEFASTQPIEAYNRRVPSSSWYATMREVGLNYGPAFQGLERISASIQQHAATATTANTIASGESDYQLHPTTIDHCLQVFSVGSSQGISRKFTQLAVPTHVEEIEVAGTQSLITVRVSATSTTKGSIVGKATGVDASGKPVLTMRGVKLSPLDSNAGSASDSHAAAVLKWRPDIDFLNPKDLIRPLSTKKEQMQLAEKLALACIVESDYLLKSDDGSSPHLKKFRAWLGDQVALIHAGEYRLVEDARDTLCLSSEDRNDLIESLADQIRASPAAACAEIIMKVFQNCKSIVNNEEEPLPILYADNALQNLYDFMDACNRTGFLALLGHSKPQMKILEIGAGTGGTTEQILRDLRATTGERTYSTYTFTDISAGFFVAAKERFKDAPGIEYSVLDISQDPLAQGFEAQSYDLIIATNVLHATPKLVQTLKNVRMLLRPDGRLLLQELCPTARWVNYVMGVLPGWWLGEEDARPSEPFVSPERWADELCAAGFARTEAVIYDDEPPYHINAIMIVKAGDRPSPAKRVTLLTRGTNSPVQQTIERQFVDAGYHIDFCTLDQVPPAKQDIISLLDAAEPFFENISAGRFESFKQFIDSLDVSGLLWPTKTTRPGYAQVLGIARAVRSEMSLEFATLETVDFAPRAVLEVFQKFQGRATDDARKTDYEFAVRNGVIHISRFQPHSVHQQLLETPLDSGLKCLEIGRPGKLQTLQWTQHEASGPADDEVEIEMKAVGMNFKDVLVAMGILEFNNLDLGNEGAGIVRRVGAAVKEFSVGDRVLTFTSKCFSTLLNTPAGLCAKIPDDLDFASAATMPCVYATVIYSLLDVARLQQNETILIHSACGGVGLAAIQIAQMIGAQIFATVGTEEKVQYLVDTFGLSRERIFKSRDASFLSEVMRETDGRGVDVVLNSLSGELLHASWQCVASFGRMVEIGKRDFMGHGDLAMNPFLANRSFFGIDLIQVVEGKRVLANRLLEDCMKYYRQGSIQPIQPIKSFPASEVQDCFRYMQKGLHIGKIICEMPDWPSKLTGQSHRSSMAFKSNSAYLLVGGLGGLGRAVATWMVENGARHLIFLSRSAGRTDSDKEFFRELAAQGCTAQSVAGSVAQIEDVKRAVVVSEKPIKGVIQMSMVLRDQSFSQMTHQQWTEVNSPKVQGTWNLHEALGQELDFFVLFSSISGMLGNNGQANYAAANTFLDAFVPYRHQMGLPASVLDIGVMQDIGYVSQSPAILKQMKAAGAYTLHEQDLLDALQAAIAGSRPDRATQYPSGSKTVSPSQIILGLRSTIPLNDASNRTPWKNDARVGIYHNMDTSSSTSSGSSSNQSNNEIKQFLSQIQANPSTLSSKNTLSFIIRQIILQFSQLLLISEEDIDASQSPVAAGMDSLIAIEVREWWKRVLGCEISVLEVINAGSIEILGLRAVEALKGKYGGDADDGDGNVEGRDPKYLAMKAP